MEERIEQQEKFKEKYTSEVEFKLWIESFRYCLSRSSYATWEFCDNYRKYYSLIPQRAKDLINKELKEEVENYRLLGHECDKEEWKSLLHFVQEQTREVNCQK